MATIQHSALGSSERHDPKSFVVVTKLDDVSTASTLYIPVPAACTVSKIVSVLHGSITTADATITAKDAAGSSMGTLTISQSGSAAGDIDTLSPVSNNSIASDSFMTIETDGGSSTTREISFTVLLERT